MRRAKKHGTEKSYNALNMGGLCTVKKPWLLSKGKLAMAKNIALMVQVGENYVTYQGYTRPGTRRLSASPLPGAVKAHRKLGSTHLLATDEKVYYLDGDSLPVEIGDVAGAPRLVPFRGMGTVLDGDYLKVVTLGAGVGYSTLYDEAGYMFGEEWLDSSIISGSWQLHSGGMTKAGFTASTPAFGPGEIPLDRVYVYLSVEGSPTGDATIKAYSTDGATLLGTATVDVSTLTAEPLLQTLRLSAEAGKTLDTPQETARYFAVEYSGGDAANYLDVHYVDASAGLAVTDSGAGWVADAAKNPAMAVGCGLPPKGFDANVAMERLWVGGGGDDAAEKSKLHYCEPDNPYNWGAHQYQGGVAGWIGVERSDGGVITQIVRFVKSLFIFKGGDEQSIHMLTGSKPGEDGDLDLSGLFWHEGALGNTAREVGNNVLYLDNDVVLGLEGINNFTDVRQAPRSRDIADLIREYASDEAFSVYAREQDQYWLHLPELGETLVYHVGGGAWTTYEWAGITPSVFSHSDGITYIGGEDGHLYRTDETVSGTDGYFDENDTGTDWLAEVWGRMEDLGAQDLDKHWPWASWEASAFLGGSGTIFFRTDYGYGARGTGGGRFGRGAGGQLEHGHSRPAKHGCPAHTFQ